MRRAILTAVAALVTYAVVLGAAFLWAQANSRSRACPSSGTLVQVDTEARVVCLCRNGQVEGRFRSALGRGGLDKRSEGDGKTPLGRYPLSQARPSSRYHLFLPVGYPTPEQKRQGYTGADIGIHGPHIAFAWLGHATLWVNWTRGCIALGTAGEVQQIITWVQDTGATEILLI